MKQLLWLFFFPLTLFASHAVNSAVVKVFSTIKEYDYSRPWMSPEVLRLTGSGFIIEGNQIITNAHVVANATFIEVHTGRSRKKFDAKVKAKQDVCDLVRKLILEDKEVQSLLFLAVSEFTKNQPRRPFLRPFRGRITFQV